MVLRILLQGAIVGVGAVGALMGDGIAGSKHDFSQEGWSGGQLCQPCHTPHASGAEDLAPLWDHDSSATQSYTLYDGRRGMPGPASLACLSCHDGSTAIDAYGGMTGDAFIQDVGAGRARIGGRGDLTTSHPIGLEYPLIDDDFRPRELVEATGEVTLPNGKVECLSCHDVHNESGGEFLLVMPNTRSALCLTCHIK